MVEWTVQLWPAKDNMSIYIHFEVLQVIVLLTSFQIKLLIVVYYVSYVVQALIVLLYNSHPIDFTINST